MESLGMQHTPPVEGCSLAYERMRHVVKNHPIPIALYCIALVAVAFLLALSVLNQEAKMALGGSVLGAHLIAPIGYKLTRTKFASLDALVTYLCTLSNQKIEMPTELTKFSTDQGIDMFPTLTHTHEGSSLATNSWFIKVQDIDKKEVHLIELFTGKGRKESEVWVRLWKPKVLQIEIGTSMCIDDSTLMDTSTENLPSKIITISNFNFETDSSRLINLNNADDEDLNFLKRLFSDTDPLYKIQR